MDRAAVIIPNWNGKHWLKGCLGSLRAQECRDFTVYLVDNGSSDGSADWVRAHFPEVRLICLEENTGFCHAVNEGVRVSGLEGGEPYVILLNNDIIADRRFVGELLLDITRHPRAFSCQAKMLSMYDRDRIDDAGDLYCALGWAFARGRGKHRNAFRRGGRIFASCAGACILRRAVFEQLGGLDETHFAYLEDVDLGWRAALRGWQNRLAARAVVWHAGSASSGSKHNAFKVRLASRNSIWIIRKNMPVWQRLLNLPLLMAGYGIKLVFFARKGLGREYAKGLAEGMRTAPALTGDRQKKAWPFFDIQLQLWLNTLRRIGEHV